MALYHLVINTKSALIITRRALGVFQTLLKLKRGKGPSDIVVTKGCVADEVMGGDASEVRLSLLSL